MVTLLEPWVIFGLPRSEVCQLTTVLQSNLCEQNTADKWYGGQLLDAQLHVESKLLTSHCPVLRSYSCE